MNSEELTASSKAKQKQHKTYHFVLWIRIAISLAAAIALMIIKQIGGDVYKKTSEFIGNLQDNSAVIDIEADNADLLHAASNNY